jgi:ATP-dependent Clp protease adaptor protein ClpS
MSHPQGDQSDTPRRTDAAPGNRQGVAKREHQGLALYKVVLHQDDNELMFVVRCVMELTRFPRAEATHRMWEAVHCGRSVLLTTYLERAELFVVLFTDKGMKVTAERA